MSTRICVAGATGWTGSAVTRAVLAADDLELTGAVARKAAGTDVGDALGLGACGVEISATVARGLEAGADVLIDYTHPSAVKSHALAALEMGVGAVIGTSGLAAVDYDQLDERARQQGRGVIAAGNFSLTAALLKHAATLAARHVPHWEILDYSSATKPDAPSGTARELAETLGQVARNELAVPIADTLGSPGTRGATLGGAQVHSVRLPGYVLSVEAVFGLPSERLSIRHDAGTDATPYVGGTLVAARKVPGTVGLVRGLDTLLFG